MQANHQSLDNQPAALVETITPEIAKQMLSMNTRNRPLRSRTLVRKIANEIKTGRWQLNGDSIRFADNGVLLDGQHRLLAIIEADIAVQTYVIRGLDAGSFETIDTNRAARSGGDVLSIAGYKNCNNLAATAALCFLYEHYGEPFVSNANARPTPWQVHQYVESHPKIVESSDYVCSHKAGIGPMIALSHYSFAFHLMTSVNVFKARTFTEQFRSGAGLEAGSPVLLLRNRYIDDRVGKTRLESRYKLALLFKAWRLWLDGAFVKKLRIREEGNAEKNIWGV